MFLSLTVYTTFSLLFMILLASEFGSLGKILCEIILGFIFLLFLILVFERDVIILFGESITNNNR